MIKKSRMDRFTWNAGDLKLIDRDGIDSMILQNSKKADQEMNKAAEGKSQAYKTLVKKMQDRYPIYQGVPSEWKIDLWAPPYEKTANGNVDFICKEINLWTYWQGLGYAEKTPKIKYLLVGQD